MLYILYVFLDRAIFIHIRYAKFLIAIPLMLSVPFSDIKGVTYHIVFACFSATCNTKTIRKFSARFSRKRFNFGGAFNLTTMHYSQWDRLLHSSFCEDRGTDVVCIKRYLHRIRMTESRNYENANGERNVIIAMRWYCALSVNLAISANIILNLPQGSGRAGLISCSYVEKLYEVSSLNETTWLVTEIARWSKGVITKQPFHSLRVNVAIVRIDFENDENEIKYTTMQFISASADLWN